MGQKKEQPIKGYGTAVIQGVGAPTRQSRSGVKLTLMSVAARLRGSVSTISYLFIALL